MIHSVESLPDHIGLGERFKVHLDVVDPTASVQDGKRVILERGGFHLVKDQKRENLSFFHPVIHLKMSLILSASHLVFIVCLEYARYFLILVDESGKLGKSPLLEGLSWVVYT